MFKKIFLSVMGLALILTMPLGAARKRSRDGSDEKPAPTVALQVVAGETARISINDVCCAAQATLDAHFPILAIGDVASSAPVLPGDLGGATVAMPEIRDGQIGALRIAGAALRRITAVLSSGDVNVCIADKLADNAVRALQSVVLRDQVDINALQVAVDSYNAARGRAAARLANAIIVNERGMLPYSAEEIAAHDRRIPDLLMLGDIQAALAPSAAPIASADTNSVLAAVPTASTGTSDECTICLSPEDTTRDNPMMALSCGHCFHRGCLIDQFTLVINALGVPTCANCRAVVDPMPASLVAAVPTINPVNLLFNAALNGYMDGLERALVLGVDVNFRSPPYGETALHIAAENGHLDIMMKLLDHGKDITAQASYARYTPLHRAALHRHIELFRQIIQRCDHLGVREKRDSFGALPLHTAARSGYVEIVELLLGTEMIGLEAKETNFDGRTPLHNAAEYGQLAVVRYLIECGADKEARDCRGATSLHLAAAKGHVSVVSFLVEAGAARDVKNQCRETPLYLAIEAGQLAVVDYLVEHGADIEEKVLGSTNLHRAAEVGQLDIVRYLIAYGANKEAKNCLQETPLHCAAKKGQEIVVRCLLDAGANKEAKDYRGQTALDVAITNGHTAIAELLR